MQSQIERILLDIVENQIEIQRDEIKEEEERFSKSEKAILQYIKQDTEMQKLFSEFFKSANLLHCVLISKYYKEGFISGMRVALEVSGWKLPKD